MVRAKIFGLAGVAVLLSPAALAADLPPPLPPPCCQAPVVESTWYLRGFIGMSNQFLSSISHPAFDTAPQFVFLDKGGFDSAPFGGGGIGFQWNNWLRFDATVEFRGKARFHELDRFFNPFFFSGPRFNTNQFRASKSELVGLFNGFIDLGTWWGITPFIGAGVGVTQNKIEHLRDDNIIAAGGGWADTGTRVDFAWALQAGVAARVTPAVAIEFSYRFLNLGKAESGTLVNLDPTVVSGNPKAPVTFNDLQSHDFMLGVRWMLQPEPPPPPAFPIVRKG